MAYHNDADPTGQLSHVIEKIPSTIQLVDAFSLLSLFGRIEKLHSMALHPSAFSLMQLSG
jgi:hypothetical protein